MTASDTALPVDVVAQPSSRRVLWPWIVGAALVLTIVAGAFVATRVIAATRLSYASAMPPNTMAFVHLDLLRVAQDDRPQRLLEAFGVDGDDASSEIAEALSDIDAQMIDGLGFDFSNDIQPWIGRGVGVGLVELATNPEDIVALAAVDVRDADAFEAFLPKLAAAVERETGSEVRLSIHGGIAVQSWEIDGVSISVGRSGDVLLIGNGRDSVNAGIDALAGESLADVDAFVEATKGLPDDRFASIYISGERYLAEMDEMLGELAIDSSVDPFGFATPASVTAAMTLNENGLRIDAFSTFSDMEPWLRDAYRRDPRDILPRLPADTVAYLGTRNGPGIYVDAYLEMIDEALSGTGGDGVVQEARQQFRSEFGVDLVDDILKLIDGETALVATRTPGGLMEDLLDIELVAVAFLGTSDELRLEASIDTVVGTLAESNGFHLERADSALNLWMMPEALNETAFGVDEGYFLVASDLVAADGMFTDGPKLVDDTKFQQARDALPPDMTPRFYLDPSGFADAFDDLDPELMDALGPITALIAGSSGDDAARHTAAILLLDY